MARTTLLCIMDGVGWNPNLTSNSVIGAKHPTLEKLWTNFPTTTLITFGERVGLPEGQMGNSEVGHLNLGAGRVVEQWLLRISRALAGPFLHESASYTTLMKNLAAEGSPTLNLVGLYSDGGVHSHLEHLKLLVKRCAEDFKGSIVLHLITDGRDTAPRAAAGYIRELQTFLQAFARVRIGSVSGRFFMMDRDKRWERVEQAYKVFSGEAPTESGDPVAYVESCYARDTTDEFVEPATFGDSTIGPKDGVIFWNFREDRMREIVAALCTTEFEGFPRKLPAVPASRVLGFTEYDRNFHLPFLFEPIEIKNHLGEVLGALGVPQLRVAETEKYPHVTYFFNGGIETPYRLEDRVVVPSPRDVKTYDLKPEMSAEKVTDEVVRGIESQKYGLIVVNLANGDMVGHTGNLAAAIKAVEVVDRCIARMLSALEEVNGQGIITADHGNCEQMVDYITGNPHTSHTTYLVPVTVIGAPEDTKLLENCALCDVAPTLLKMMDIPIPSEMSGRPLF